MIDLSSNPLPIIGLGPEFFSTSAQAFGIDWEVLNLFRRQINVGLFRFVWLSEPNGKELFVFLREVSVAFNYFHFVQIGNRASEKYAEDMLRAMDFCYSPTVCAKLHVSNDIAVAEPSKERFLACLLRSVSYPDPYTKQNFRSLLYV